MLNWPSNRYCGSARANKVKCRSSVDFMDFGDKRPQLRMMQNPSVFSIVGEWCLPISETSRILRSRGSSEFPIITIFKTCMDFRIGSKKSKRLCFGILGNTEFFLGFMTSVLVILVGYFNFHLKHLSLHERISGTASEHCDDTALTTHRSVSTDTDLAHLPEVRYSPKCVKNLN